MIKARNIVCGYDNSVVLNNVSFDIKKNKIISILGQNGCGKSTLLKVLSNQIKYTGTVFIHDINLKNISHKKRGQTVGLVVQNSVSEFPYTVFETVLMGRFSYKENSILSQYKKTDYNKVDEVLHMLDLYHLKNRLINSLSQGQLQRVFLARVFAQDPKIILLDEAVNHLDLKYQIETMQFIKKWVENGDRYVISVLHDVNLAFNYSDEIILMKDKNILLHKDIINFPKETLNEVYNTDILPYLKKSAKIWLNN